MQPKKKKEKKYTLSLIAKRFLKKEIARVGCYGISASFPSSTDSLTPNSDDPKHKTTYH